MLVVIILGIILLLTKVSKIMATELDLEADIQAVADAVTVLADEIAALKAAGVGAVTQAQLDALDAKAKAIAAAAQAAV